MKKIIAKLIHSINPTYFQNKTFDTLEKWGISDVYKGKLIFE